MWRQWPALSAPTETDDEDMSRPFGVALLVAGHDVDNGYQLCHTDHRYLDAYKAKAIGSGSEGANHAAGGTRTTDPEGG